MQGCHTATLEIVLKQCYVYLNILVVCVTVCPSISVEIRILYSCKNRRNTCMYIVYVQMICLNRPSWQDYHRWSKGDSRMGDNYSSLVGTLSLNSSKNLGRFSQLEWVFKYVNLWTRKSIKSRGILTQSK